MNLVPRALLYIAIAAAVLLALHLLAIGAESRGWIYYRKGRGRNWGVSAAAQELQSLLQPSARHVVEQAQEEELLREESGDAADDDDPAIDATEMHPSSHYQDEEVRMNAIVRPERAGDVEAIREILVGVFSDMEHSSQTEHLIVDALRDSGALTLSLVAEVDGCVAGHIAFSPASVGDEQTGWFVLGPLSVARDRQGCGLARALVEEGVRQLQERGARGIVLVGDPALYGRFGFRHEPQVVWPQVPDEYVLVLVLSGGVPTGEISCDAAFFIEPASGTVHVEGVEGA